MKDIGKSEVRPDSEDNISGKPSFIEELRRRKVFRVSITYTVVSWIIIQVAATTFENFGIPVWAFRFVVLMLLLGFPVAIILTWAFELTPEGVRKIRATGESTPGLESSSLNRKRNWFAIGLAAVIPTLIFGTLAVFFYFGQSDSTKSTTTGSVRQGDRSYVIGSIAVLPFAVISADESIRMTAEGLQEETLTTLSEMEPLDVVSRTSTMRYGSKSASIPEMGKELGADFIVEGSIQAIGNKVRVTLQLIEAPTDNHIWAGTFDRGNERKEDLLVFQKEMAYELAISIYKELEKDYPPKGEIAERRQKLITGLEEKLAADYDQFWIDFDRASDWDKRFDSILSTIHQIIRIDPDNTNAHEANAGIMFAATNVGKRDFYNPEYRKEYYLILKRAYAVAPDGFDTNKHLGIYYNLHENNPRKALPYSRKAVDIEKDLKGAVNMYTYWMLLESLCETGQISAASKIIDTVQEENEDIGTAPDWFWTRSYDLLGQFDKRIAFFDSQIESIDKEKDLYTYLNYSFIKAITLSHWTGSTKPLEDFRSYVSSYEDAPPWILGFLSFQLGNYQDALNFLSEVQTGSSWNNAMALDLAGARGWAYFKTNNLALSRSYFKGFLNELENSMKGQWMQIYQPDIYSASQSYANACLGNKEDALLYAERALSFADPSRQMEDYFTTIEELAKTYSILKDFEKASELIDQILSSPSGISTGQMLLAVKDEPILESPEFEAVIRKHAEQLKDPAILAEYFGD